MSAPVASRPSFFRALVPVWLVTAAWDFVCATALSVFAYGTSAASLWQGVAATVLGPSATLPLVFMARRALVRQPQRTS